MLSERELIFYLVDRGLLDAHAIVNGELKVVDVSSRNSNFKITRTDGQNLLVKQGISSDGVVTVGYEASIYQYLWSHPSVARFKRFLPSFLTYDPVNHVLVLELIRDARSVNEHHRMHTRLSVQRSKRMGQALAAFHGNVQTSCGISDESVLTKHEAPWALSLHRPNLTLLREISSANIQMVKIIQRSQLFRDMIDVLHHEWSPSALIHADVKWDNMIAYSTAPTRPKVGLKIVDWELAGIGDPSWDIGSVFSEYLSHWLLSMPIAGDTPPERFAELARCPLDSIKPAIRAFWRSYAHEMGYSSNHESLVKSARYCAARLLQTAYEQMQYALNLTGRIICCLQLSFNILRKPEDAVVRLLGLPV